MENASKALIIAGAILLSILIIALGVFIFNQAKSAMGNTGLTDQQVSAFNSKFEAYEGKIKGTQAKALVDLIRSNNNTVEGDSGESIELQFAGTKTDADSSAKNKIKSGESYTVTLTYRSTGATKGYVQTINIAGNFNS